MTKIGDIIKDYLNSWVECEYCSDMCKLEHITSDCSDNPICKDCVEEEYRTHFNQWVFSSFMCNLKYKDLER